MGHVPWTVEEEWLAALEAAVAALEAEGLASALVAKTSL
jgi:hypothetical protein